MTNKVEPPLEERDIDPKTFRKANRRAFLLWGAIGGLGVWQLFKISTLESDRGIPWLLRKVNDVSDSFWKSNFRNDAKAPKVIAQNPIRVNGYVGLEDRIDASAWRLKVIDPELSEPRLISLEEIKKLSPVTVDFEFKCIEGWSRNVSCTGVRFSDFMKAFDVGTRSSGQMNNPNRVPYAFSGMRSINDGYYVSMPAKSLQHSQTILCWEMNGEPLTPKNGAPLRLITAVHYGVKSIKQLGSIEFMEVLPADYWAERGYGDYLGL